MSEREAELQATDLTVGYGERPIIKSLSLDIPPGQTTGLIGANGSGKSTLLKAMARALKPSEGAVMLDGQAIHQTPTKAVARRLGLLPQGPSAPGGITVEALVSLGRFPHRRGFGLPTAEDKAAVASALARTQLTALAARPVESLSGGQRQRAWIALALAQQAPIMLLDEPTTFLDIAHQAEVLEVIEGLRAAGHTIVVVLHDLLQAARHCDHLVALRAGEVIAEGAPASVLSPSVIESVFGVRCTVIEDPCTGRPLVIPHPSVGRRASR